jgi:D-alanyl-D-alanine dipeptidase
MPNINPADLVPLDIFIDKEPILIDLVYADASHPRNIFETAIYHDGARLWAHRDIAVLTLLTARILKNKHDWVLEIQDCLRTVDAQAAMQETDIVKAHPEWCLDGPDRMLSPPGLGAHPRAMAIDLGPLDSSGDKVNMGTLFDDMSEKSARDYIDFSVTILDHRKTLENAFIQSADLLNFPLYLVKSEWWDYRFPQDYYNQYAPLNDKDLPPQMQMANRIDNDIKDFDDEHFQKLADSITALVERSYGDL